MSSVCFSSSAVLWGVSVVQDVSASRVWGGVGVRNIVFKHERIARDVAAGIKNIMHIMELGVF